MKILVIPDVHLKPWMFDRAQALMKLNIAERVVCLMDLVDDWGKRYMQELYAETLDRAAKFQKEFQDTLWCWGNHDIAYLWQQKVSGSSPVAPKIVCDGIDRLKELLPDQDQLAYIHRVDDVLFMHGGMLDLYVDIYVYHSLTDDLTECRKREKEYDTDTVIRTINSFGYEEMWTDMSPIWFRPQYRPDAELYKADTLFQVVGHTPVKRITRELRHDEEDWMHEMRRTRNFLSCDVFSTYSNGDAIGIREFPVVDTETWEWNGIRA